MRHRLAILSALAALFLCPLHAYGQDNWDAVLDRYENICEECLGLRSQMLAGQSVKEGSVAKLLSELGELRARISNASGGMSAAQRGRFNEIRECYDRKVSGTDAQTKAPAGSRSRGEMRNVSMQRAFECADAAYESSAPHLSAGRLTPSLQAFVMNDSPELAPPFSSPGFSDATVPLVHVSNEARASGGMHILFIPFAEIGRTAAPGCLLGLVNDSGNGFYVSAASNFVPGSAAFSVFSDGTMPGGAYFWGDGNTRTSALALGLGRVQHVWKQFSCYAGIGYGRRALLWEDTSGSWAAVSDLCVSGVLLDAGAILAPRRHFCFSAGVCWIVSALPSSVRLGLGWRF